MRLALDFDGVLAKEEIPRTKTKIGEPMEGALQAVLFLRGLGYECFVFTSRGKDDWSRIKEWLVRWGFPEMEVTNRKMNAVAYIDNQAIRFTNWKDVVRYFG